MTTPSQQSLFDRAMPVRLNQTPIARATDPLSSHLAAAEVTRTGTRAAQADAVLTAVRRWPGRTSRELAALAKADRYVFARRCPELRDAGLIRQGEMRGCTEGNGRMATTWWPVTTEARHG